MGWVFLKHEIMSTPKYDDMLSILTAEVEAAGQLVGAYSRVIASIERFKLRTTIYYTGIVRQRVSEGQSTGPARSTRMRIRTAYNGRGEFLHTLQYRLVKKDWLGRLRHRYKSVAHVRLEGGAPTQHVISLLLGDRSRRRHARWADRRLVAPFCDSGHPAISRTTWVERHSMN